MVKIVVVSPRGVRGNLGATPLSAPRGTLNGPKGKKEAGGKDSVVVSISGKELVHKVATKFIEGITPIAACKVVVVVEVSVLDDRGVASDEVHCVV